MLMQIFPLTSYISVMLVIPTADLVGRSPTSKSFQTTCECLFHLFECNFELLNFPEKEYSF